MKRVMQEIQQQISAFARRPGRRLMIVACEPEDSTLLLKAIDAVEADENVPDVFLTFSHPFASAAEFVAGVLAIVRTQANQLNEELEKQSRKRVAEPPAPAGAPDQQLIAAMEYARAVVPRGSNVVWVLYPLEVGDPASYRTLIRSVLGRAGVGTLSGTRILARDSAKESFLAPEFEHEAGVTVYRPELDTQSLEQKFAEQANDPSTPQEEQATLHMMLAGFDVTNGRYDAALQRNLELLRYFRHTKQVHQQSVVLANIGDIYYLNRQFGEAQLWYERALHESVTLESEPMVMYQTMDAGNALLMQGRFAEARGYYTATRQLAHKNSAMSFEVQAIELIGQTHYAAGELREAEQAWNEALEVSNKLNFEEGRRSSLTRLVRLYQEIGDQQGVARCEREMATAAGA